MTRFRAHFNVLVLQHPHERRKYYSTAKLLTQAIENCRVVRGVEFDPSFLQQVLEGQRAHLLFPQLHAIECAQVSLDSESTVIVVDGTWREAGKIIYRNALLKELPCISFKTPMTSTYQIRKQPKAGCLSTLESVGHLLRHSAKAQGLHSLLPSYDSLFDGFHQMIARQLSYWPRSRFA